MWIKILCIDWIYFVGNTNNGVYIWCCKYGENRYCESCANKYWCAFKHTGLLNPCLGKWYLIPYLVVPLISARVPLISTRVSAHCQAILFVGLPKQNNGHKAMVCAVCLSIFVWHILDCVACGSNWPLAPCLLQTYMQCLIKLRW